MIKTEKPSPKGYVEPVEDALIRAEIISKPFTKTLDRLKNKNGGCLLVTYLSDKKLKNRSYESRNTYRNQ